jgi:Tfp pilus assembly PilM family ATPase
MSKFISVECDAHEIRLAVGSTGLTGVSIEKVLSGPLSIEEGTQPWGTPQATAALKDLLQQAGIKTGSVIACVSRNDIELRAITLPMVDTNELPDMVRFAAPRYFASVNDSWPLDFITMPSHLEGSIDCIVGAINPALIQKIDATVTEAGLTLKHMVLRPMAAAAGAIAKHPEWNNSTVLFIDLLNEEADVVITERGKSVFMRSFYAATDPQDPMSVKTLAGEVKRTIMSAVSQRPGLKVDQLVVWTKDSLAPFAQALSQAVEIPVKMLDPFSMAERAEISVAATTQTVGRFAPVMGALQFPNSSDRLIDFVNPRKKVEQKKPIGSYILGAAAAAGLLGASWWWYSSSHAALDQDIQLLKDEIAGEATILKSSAKNLADWKKLETYLAGDVLWVDELERLSQNAKDSDTTYFGGTTFALEPRTNSPTIVTKFFTKEQDLVPEIQGSYRDEKHNVQGTGLAQSQDKKFRVVADMKITVANPQVKDPRNVTRKPIEEAKPKEPAIETVAEPAAEVQSLEPAESEAKTTPPDPLTQPPENKGQDPKSPSPPSASEQTPTEPTPTEPSKPATEPILGGAS